MFAISEVERKRTGEVGLVAKAWNGRIILVWLSHCLQEVLAFNPADEKLVMASAAMILDFSEAMSVAHEIII